MPQEQFSSGQIVPHSGIYTVTHAQHRLPHQVTLLQGQYFPACAQCGEAVRFEIARALQGLHDRREQILLYSLPELPTDAEGEQPKSSGQSTSPAPDASEKALEKRKPRAKAHRKGARS